MSEQGGPAFPFGYETGFKTFKQYSGMSLRDYFAAKAMQAMVPHYKFDSVAARAYEMADAMLAARGKP